MLGSPSFPVGLAGYGIERLTLPQNRLVQSGEGGPKVEIFRFNTTNEEDDRISNNIDEQGGCSPFLCATCSGNVLRGIGPFEDLGSTITPWGTASEMKKLKNEENKKPKTEKPKADKPKTDKPKKEEGSK